MYLCFEATANWNDMRDVSPKKFEVDAFVMRPRNELKELGPPMRLKTRTALERIHEKLSNDFANHSKDIEE
jgi:hypothetical protein